MRLLLIMLLVPCVCFAQIRKPVTTDNVGNVTTTPLIFSNQVVMTVAATQTNQLVRYQDMTNFTLVIGAITNVTSATNAITVSLASKVATLNWTNTPGYLLKSGDVMTGILIVSNNFIGTRTNTLSGLRYPLADGTTNQLITTDGAGRLYFANLSGSYTNGFATTGYADALTNGYMKAAVTNGLVSIGAVTNLCFPYAATNGAVVGQAFIYTNIGNGVTWGTAGGSTLPTGIAFTPSNNVFTLSNSFYSQGSEKNWITIGTNEQATAVSLAYSGTNLLTIVVTNQGVRSAAIGAFTDTDNGGSIAFGSRTAPNIFYKNGTTDFLAWNANAGIVTVGATYYYLHCHTSGVSIGGTGNLQGLFVNTVCAITSKGPHTFNSNGTFNVGLTIGGNGTIVTNNPTATAAITFAAITATNFFATNLSCTGATVGCGVIPRQTVTDDSIIFNVCCTNAGQLHMRWFNPLLSSQTPSTGTYGGSAYVQ